MLIFKRIFKHLENDAFMDWWWPKHEIVLSIMVSQRIVWFLIQHSEYIHYTSYIFLNTCKLFVVDFWINLGSTGISGYCVSKPDITFLIYIRFVLTCMLLFPSTSCTKRWKYVDLVEDVEQSNYNVVRLCKNYVENVLRNQFTTSKRCLIICVILTNTWFIKS